MKRLFAILLACMLALTGCQTGSGPADNGKLAKNGSEEQIQEPDEMQEENPQVYAKDSLSGNNGTVEEEGQQQEDSKGKAEAEQQQGGNVQEVVEDGQKTDSEQKDKEIEEEGSNNGPKEQSAPSSVNKQKDTEDKENSQPDGQKTDETIKTPEDATQNQVQNNGSENLTSGSRYAGTTYIANGFSVSIPQSWEGRYGVQRTEDRWIFYDAEIPEWGLDGRGELASIQVFGTQEEQEAAGTGEVLGNDSQMTRFYILNKPEGIPVPETSGEDLINGYKEMAEGLSAFAEGFTIIE